MDSAVMQENEIQAKPSAIKKSLHFLAWASAFLLVFLLFVGFQNAKSMMQFNNEGTRTAKFETMSAAQKVGLFLFGFQRPRPENLKTPESIGLPYEEFEIPSKDGRKLQLWKIPGEKSEALFILFHGYVAKKERLLPAAKILHARGFSSILVDFPGSGGASGSITTMGILEALDVKSVFEFAREKFPQTPLVLFGSSMGAAAIARAVALENISPDGLILESPFDSFLQTMRNRFLILKVPSFPLAEFIVGWMSVLSGTNVFGHAPAKFASSLQMPVLQLQGEKDIKVSHEQAQNIFREIPGQKHLQIFPNVGHKFFAQTHPELWENTVMEFVATLQLGISLQK